ncbi:MAG TPA: branched-chain amino acid ABC transporter permease [Gaiellaceae bacterium]|nr:branched-chain amino acid ABC transporter permease [Gaiellaceae bacterium]
MDVLRTGVRAIWPLPALLGLVAAAAEIAWAAGDSVTRGVVIVAMINLTLVIGLYVFVGNSGVFSFGSVGFASIGAYTAALLVIPPDQKSILQPDLPGFIARADFTSVEATLMGGVVAAAAGAVLSIPLMRLNGIAAALATFAVLVIIRTVANSWTQVTNGAAGISGAPVTTSKNAALVWALIAIVVGFVFQSTGLALRLRGSREDDVAARSLGVNIRTERRVAWVIHAFVMGVGGGLYAQYLGSFNSSFFYLALTFTTLAMLVVGGIKSLTGAVIGSLTISFIAEFLHRVEQGADVGPLHIPARPGLREVGLAIIMLVILVLRPRGLTNGRELPWPRLPRRRGGVVRRSAGSEELIPTREER